MTYRYFVAVLATVLLIGYLIPVAFKVKELAFTLVIATGIGMMLVDLWQSLKSKDD